MCVKNEAHVAELAGEKERLRRQIRELKEQHQEAKQEMEKRYSEFNMQLQKTRDEERISKRTSGLEEQLQEKAKIIWMNQRKILELNEKNNTDVKEQQQLVEMKEKVELIFTLAIFFSFISAEGVMVPSTVSLILPSGLCEKCQEKFAASIGDGSAVMLGPDLNGKGVVAKVWRGVSVARKINSGGGGGCGRADATVQQKTNETENENEDADGTSESALADDLRAEGAVRKGD
ncbi:uncharacterized protein MONOS_11844 [Monocercomonoides exilis]|uniref:uncharacterized protein n=1 Tax=Monocercomonoides exilis TaxID=2049356 RepID=UPI003559F148|nr:hypothetical protein MONOS_11844 [Monocercomonoides exilis]|eukprot:MONOS_11844.1-p1 / transcript=MONOS_11844.1 / gene=MONOS_11844 / organism=Monocercomonoides_exilis_PA203 / gene_product=unspecified product / transcript_product=unspecified product / location=Mono_scaffold00617:33422-34208(+) / protein_length=233 / sequence_SO=supercontig / SO=protein_coding / is_pseudo=false